MALPPDKLRALDSVRTRLYQLNETLSLIQRELASHDPLPTWPQICNLQSAMSFALGQLNDTMTQHAQLLREAHVYPSPTFPGHKEGELLYTLLRKKLDVAGEEWIEEYTAAGKEEFETGTLGQEGFEGLWEWARGCSQGVVGPMVENGDFDDEFTLQEREDGVENVRTGLRRKMWEDDSGDEEEVEGEKMDEDQSSKEEVEEAVVDVGVDVKLAPLALEDVMRFAIAGVMPTKAPNR